MMNWKFLPLLACAASLLVPLTTLAQRKPKIIMVTHGQAADSFWLIVRNGAEAAAATGEVAASGEAPAEEGAAPAEAATAETAENSETADAVEEAPAAAEAAGEGAAEAPPASNEGDEAQGEEAKS